MASLFGKKKNYAAIAAGALVAGASVRGLLKERKRIKQQNQEVEKYKLMMSQNKKLHSNDNYKKFLKMKKQLLEETDKILNKTSKFGNLKRDLYSLRSI